MLYGNYRFICRFEEDASLPSFKGSTIRGAFGHALKKVVCALHRQQCPACLLRERCLYARVFESEAADRPESNPRISANPHPFVIEPPPETKTDYRKDDRLECGLLLFGDFNGSLPYFVYAFERMGEFGIGKKTENREGGRFALEAVECGGRVIYSEKERLLKTAEAARDISLAEPPLQAAFRRVEITLETPLRFKSDGRLRDELPFEVLVRLMLRRVSSLMNAYSGGEPPLDYRGLVQRARSVGTVQSNLRWFDWRRYSNRQDSEMKLGGLVGEATYEGDLNEFMPLLEFSSHVHIGKQTSFGLGKMKI